MDANHYADMYNASGPPAGEIRILDSTLLEGEMHPGVSLTAEQKLDLAIMLDEFGVSQMDISPAISRDHLEATRSIVRQGLAADVVACGRAERADVDAALDCGAGWVAAYLGVSDVRLAGSPKAAREEAIERAVDVVGYAKRHGLRVRLTLEDAGRADPEFLQGAAAAADGAGADRIGLTDPVGTMLPDGMRRLVGCVRGAARAPIDINAHNDVGLALANALAACEAGADQIHASINGVGERTGIPALAETAVALTYLYKAPNRFRLEMLQEMSRRLCEYTGIPPHDSMPVVGECAYKHKAGTHLAAILRNPRAYEPVPPQAVGNRRSAVFGELAGKAGAAYLMAVLGIGGGGGPEEVAASLKNLGRDLVDVPLDDRLQERMAGAKAAPN